MSYFQRLDHELEEHEQEQRQERPTAGSRFADFGDRIARAFTTQERGRMDHLVLEPGETEPEERVDAGFETELTPRFAVGPFGYSRSAVDAYIADLERELEELRHERPNPISITDEIERIGEQTASILVVAHDQAHETIRRANEQAEQTTRQADEHAHETTRRADEQAERCISDAAANAVHMTERARQQLRELDNETDAVWRERIRLLEDARSTGSALIALSREAAERFPEDTKTVGPFGIEPAVDDSGQETAAMDPIHSEE